MGRRRRRRISEEEHENHERWLVSYADFITLLFAFFVVMYSLSSVNEGKYRILSNSLISAFGNAQTQNASPVILPPVILPREGATPPARKDTSKREKRKQKVAKMRNMAEEIRQVLQPLEASGEVAVNENAHGISVQINANALFASGEADLNRGAIVPLEAVARVLATGRFPIKVEGHTDTTPIKTYRFPSNWELSSARAASVVRLFIDNGVSAQLLTAAGYSDQRPLADNDTREGRARNRRVAIHIESFFGEEDAVSAEEAPAQIDPQDPMRGILPPEDSASLLKFDVAQ